MGRARKNAACSPAPPPPRCARHLPRSAGEESGRRTPFLPARRGRWHATQSRDGGGAAKVSMGAILIVSWLPTSFALRLSHRSHSVPISTDESFPEIRESVRRLCARFPGEYWRALDRERAYPTEFVRTLTEEGFLSVLIPEEYGGSASACARRRPCSKKSIAPARTAAPVTPRCTRWARSSGTAAPRRKRNICPGSRAANCVCRPSA